MNGREQKYRRLHDEALEYIAYNLPLFGITRPETIFIEPQFYPEKKDWFFEPDLFVRESHGGLHIIEYKNSGGHRKRAVRQLTHAGLVTLRALGSYPKLHFVWDPEVLHHAVIGKRERQYVASLKKGRR